MAAAGMVMEVAVGGLSIQMRDYCGLSRSANFFSPPAKSLCRPPTPATSQFQLKVAAVAKSRSESVRIRHIRIRKKLSGTPERPRLAVFRSNKHLYAQVIDDTKGCTLAAASTIQKDLREQLQLSAGPTIDSAKQVGAEIAKICLDKGISKVAFDRGGFVYHGRIKALADAARENGLIF